MPKDTATLALDGRVSLAEFTVAVAQFQNIIDGLTESVVGIGGVSWEIAALEYGSALVTVRGMAERRKAVTSVISAFERVGKSVQGNRPVPYGQKVQRSTEKLCSLLGGDIKAIRFETEDVDAVFVSPALRKAVEEEPVVTYGAAEGRIQSMTNRHGLRFTLYDLRDDHAVSCYLRDGCEDVMRNSWGKMAIVEGLVRRDLATGRITTIREIAAGGVQVIEPEEPDSWREAIGCAPPVKSGVSPEEAVRRARDE